MAKPSKSWYSFVQNEAGEPAQLIIEGEIGGWWDGNDSKSFRDALARIGANEALNVHIMSGGGSVFEGNEIANILGAHKGTVTVTLGSICASIATVIMCAGSKVTAARNSMVMIHDPSVYAAGDSAELRKMADVMDKLKSGIVATYAAKTGKTEEECADAMSEETWMTAEEAKAFGFVDEITGDDADDEAIDNVALTHYKNCSSLFARLQNQMSLGKSGGGSGNGQTLTIRAIKNAAATPPPKTPTVPEPNLPKNMTPAEIEAENQKKIREGVIAARNAEKQRKADVMAVVAQEKKRTGVDFTDEANTFLDTTENPATAFFQIILASEKKPAVVGSGIEVVDSLKAYAGTPGHQFVMSRQGQDFFERWKNQGRSQFALTLAVPASFMNATQTSTSPHTLTSIEYKPGVAPLGLRVLRIKEIIPGGATNATTIRGRREDAFTDDATSVTEVGALPNLAVSVIEVDYPVKDLGGYIEVSENLMADYEAVMSLINVRVPYKVERVTDYQLLNGAGAGADLTGILGTVGIQTQAKAADSAVDALFKAKTLVENVPDATQSAAGGGYNPDYFVVNPLDWQNIRLTKDANGQYYGGGPFTAAYGGAAGFSNVDMIWGLPVIRTTAIPAGTALVGAFGQCSQWFQRQGLVIEMTNSNGTNFINRIVTIRAAERLALTVDQPNGFAQVTGL